MMFKKEQFIGKSIPMNDMNNNWALYLGGIKQDITLYIAHLTYGYINEFAYGTN